MGNELAPSKNEVVIIQPWKRERKSSRYTGVHTLTEPIVCRGTFTRYTGQPHDMHF